MSCFRAQQRNSRILQLACTRPRDGGLAPDVHGTCARARNSIARHNYKRVNGRRQKPQKNFSSETTASPNSGAPRRHQGSCHTQHTRACTNPACMLCSCMLCSCICSCLCNLIRALPQLLRRDAGGLRRHTEHRRGSGKRQSHTWRAAGHGTRHYSSRGDRWQHSTPRRSFWGACRPTASAVWRFRAS